MKKDSPQKPKTHTEVDEKALTLTQLIQKTERLGLESLKEFQNEKGEISNIEHIYKKVFGNKFNYQ